MGPGTRLDADSASVSDSESEEEQDEEEGSDVEQDSAVLEAVAALSDDSLDSGAELEQASAPQHTRTHRP